VKGSWQVFEKIINTDIKFSYNRSINDSVNKMKKAVIEGYSLDVKSSSGSTLRSIVKSKLDNINNQKTVWDEADKEAGRKISEYDFQKSRLCKILDFFDDKKIN